MNDQTKLYEAFCVYIEACVKLNKILWDSVASVDLLKSNQKESHFIRNFESTEEFKDLARLLFEHHGYKKPNTENVFEYSEYKEHYERPKGCLYWFFTNTGIYDKIISGGDFNKERAFSIFLEELEKKEMQILEYGEVFPLKMEKNQILELGDFSLLTDLNKHGIEEKTKFVFIVKYSTMPFGFDEITKITTSDVSFSDYLLMLNLYFDKPVYLRGIYETELSLFSRLEPVYSASQYINSAEDNYDKALQEYMQNKYPAEWYAIFESGETDWEKLDEWDRLKAEKEEEFIKSDKAPIIYLKESEVEQFKKFITQIKGFLRSGVYKDQKYLKIATHYFLMGHEKPNTADNLINYVIALESLYFAQETSEMKERLANRIANFLGKTPEGKIKIREVVLQVYNLRCKYVHGKITDLDKSMREEFDDEGWFNDWLRNLLRISILSFYSLSKDYDSDNKRKELLKNLDSVFDPVIIGNIQEQAKDFLELARPCDFLNEKEDNGNWDIVRIEEL